MSQQNFDHFNNLEFEKSVYVFEGVFGIFRKYICIPVSKYR